MEGEEHGHEDSTMTMLIKLQKEQEMLKKKSTDEIEALKVKNIYMKQKLKEEDTILFNLTREYVGSSIRPNPTTINNFDVSHRKSHIVSHDVYGSSIRKHPFCKGIMEVLLPDN